MEESFEQDTDKLSSIQLRNLFVEMYLSDPHIANTCSNTGV